MDVNWNEVEHKAAQLELTEEEWKQKLDQTAEFLVQFLKSNRTEPIFYSETEKDTQSDQPERFDQALPYSEILKILQTEINEKGLNAASAMHFGYIPGGGQLYAGIADLISCTINKYVGIYEVAPGGVKMENDLIRWNAELVGYDTEQAGGHISSGGSLANLTAVVAARDEHLNIQDFVKARVYVTTDTHHCVQKALRIAGFIANEINQVGNIRYIQLDDRYRMNISALKEAIQEDREAGLIPWMVVASAGTTNVGAIDPLGAIADICESEKIWMHVDAAYGGYFNLLPECKSRFSGLNRADSVSLDGHKSFFLPYGIGTIVLKDKQKLLRSFYYDADYIQDSQALLSPANTSPELTKPFRSLRMWLPLKVLGVQPFIDNLREKLLLGQYAYDQLAQIEQIDLFNKPELSVTAFQFRPIHSQIDVNVFNQRLLERIVNAGRAFISGTWLKKHGEAVFVLRIAVLVFRSHKKHVDLAIEEIIDQAKKLEYEILI